MARRGITGRSLDDERCREEQTPGLLARRAAVTVGLMFSIRRRGQGEDGAVVV